MHLTQLTKRLIAALLAVTLIAPTYAAAPNQYNPNTVVPTGIDNSTGNAATPYVDHTSGALYAVMIASSGVTTTILATSSVANTGSSAPAAATQIGGADASGNLQTPRISAYGGENALVVDNVANGTVGASAPLQTSVNGGLDSSGNVRTILIGGSGVQITSNEGQKPTFAGGLFDVVPAASATDVTCLIGSATKTVKVTRVQVSGDAATSSSVDFLLYKRTAANTGGTSSVIATTPYDSTDPAATASIVQYSANPASLGAGVVVRSDEYGVALDVNGYPNQPVIWDFGIRNTRYIVLRGTAQSVCLNMNGLPVPSGLNLYIDFEWTEE